MGSSRWVLLPFVDTPFSGRSDRRQALARAEQLTCSGGMHYGCQGHGSSENREYGSAVAGTLQARGAPVSRLGGRAMRVITGWARGRRLQAAPGMALRPTADKVKGALFSILESRFSLESAHVLDLFAGSGALGIEALSRGAASATFVEQAAASLHCLRENLKRCGFADRARIVPTTVRRALPRLGRERARFDGVLLDPPYGKDLLAHTLAQLVEADVLRHGAWVVAEHHVTEVPPATCASLRLTQTRHYGKTGLALYVANDPMSETSSQVLPARRAVYAGSFDPFTNGHLDVVCRALEVFDQVVVAVAGGTSDPGKTRALFSAEERVAMIREALAQSAPRATADSFSGLLVDYCERVGARAIIRGLRAVSDFEYEFQMAMMNRHLKPRVETFFMAAGEAHFYTASRLVKEVASLGGDVRGLVPDAVYQRLMDKLQSKG
ncbi:MAG: pantetheine-phosphate adenylyltransferase [Deltaproteobacteria bacterium]|nr:pantetheine-phosphate adenylyltransferase [Deltaproteobacteria bacterium]